MVRGAEEGVVKADVEVGGLAFGDRAPQSHLELGQDRGRGFEVGLGPVARRPFGGQRSRQVMHRSLGGVVVALRLRPVDDEARHRADVDNGA